MTSSGPASRGLVAPAPGHPPLDAELAKALEAARDAVPVSVTAEMIPELQSATASTADDAAGLEARFGVRLVTRRCAGGPDLVVAHEEGTAGSRGAPIIFFVHGGGMIMGGPLLGLDLVLPWARSSGAVVVSPDYRLAPQHPDPAPSDDCWSALLWTAEHAEELGADASRILVVGHSAGAGVAAGLALRARDAGRPHLLGQLLMCPMLDDRQSTRSSQELDGQGVWDRTANGTAWRALLGDRAGGPGVSAHAAPARSDDLSGLVPAYLDVGSVDTFRDEVVDYARRLWAAGGDAELHVWPGAYHCFEIVAPTAAVSQQALRARSAWALRWLAHQTPDHRWIQS